MAFKWSHMFVYSIFINVSCMGYFSKISTALYCTVQLLLYIFILSISEVLEMLVLSSEHVYTKMHLMSVWSYQSVWSSCVLYYSDAFIMPLASVNISSSCQRLFRCYLSSLWSFCWFHSERKSTSRNTRLNLKRVNSANSRCWRL